MSVSTFNVTLHHLAAGAKAAGVGFADENLPVTTAPQLVELLQALAEVASQLTIYESSTPEIRIKTDREVYVVRTRYRRLWFVGYEAALRGEQHSVSFIMATISGVAEPIAAPRPFERPATASPVGSRAPTPPTSMLFPEWTKVAALLVLSLACLGTGVWLLVKPPRSPGPKFDYLTADESNALLQRTAGEYRTGIQEGDRRLIIGADGTLRIAKYGAAQAIAEEAIRTVRGARQDQIRGLVTTDPYLMIVQDADSVVLYGQTYKRVRQ